LLETAVTVESSSRVFVHLNKYQHQDQPITNIQLLKSMSCFDIICRSKSLF